MTTADVDDIQSMVIEDMIARREFGIKKYGHTLRVFDKELEEPDMLVQLYEELLDACCYIKCKIEEDRLNYEADMR